jgi:hypothetical protein
MEDLCEYASESDFRRAGHLALEVAAALESLESPPPEFPAPVEYRLDALRYFLWSEAIELAAEVAPIVERELPEDSEDTDHFMKLKVELALTQKDQEAAMATSSQRLAAVQRRVPRHFLRLAEAMTQHARVLASGGDSDGALSLIEEATEILARRFPSDRIRLDALLVRRALQEDAAFRRARRGNLIKAWQLLRASWAATEEHRALASRLGPEVLESLDDLTFSDQ